MTRAVRHGLLGIAMGVALGLCGFSSWDQLHAMFTLRDPRLFLTFGGTVALVALAWPLLGRARGVAAPARRIHSGSVRGGLLFGVGWAIAGACPAAIAIQIGEGQLLAVATLAGLLLGNWAFAVGQGRIFRFNPGAGCSTQD